LLATDACEVSLLMFIEPDPSDGIHLLYTTLDTATTSICKIRYLYKSDFFLSSADNLVVDVYIVSINIKPINSTETISAIINDTESCGMAIVLTTFTIIAIIEIAKKNSFII
jgi:hypothetical protein